MQCRRRPLYRVQQRCSLGMQLRQRVVKTEQSIGGGFPERHARIGIDKPGERALHLTEGIGDLHQITEFERPVEVARRGHYEGEDHCELPIETLGPDQLFLCTDQGPVVVDDPAESVEQACAFGAFAVIERDALGVLAHPHHAVAKIGFEFLLLEIQPDQRAADRVCQPAAGYRIDHRYPDHIARNRHFGVAEQEGERPGDRPQDRNEGAERDHGIEQAHRQKDREFGEQSHVFSDALIRIVGRCVSRGIAGAGKLKAVIGTP